MLVDWFTLGAQIINFLVLVALLKYFLFDRITRAMEEREKKISSRLAEAAEIKEQARHEMELCTGLRRELLETRQRTFQEIRDEAQSLRRKLLDEARFDTDRLKARWQESVETEKRAFLLMLRKRIGDEAISISRSSLSDLADADLEDQIIRTFSRRLRSIAPEKAEHIREMILNPAQAISVKSGFELSEDQKNSLADVLREAIGPEVKVEFSRYADLKCGIRLSVPGLKIEWNIESYLDHLEKEVAKALEGPSEKSKGSLGMADLGAAQGAGIGHSRNDFSSLETSESDPEKPKRF